jgi:hypothetical protein
MPGDHLFSDVLQLWFSLQWRFYGNPQFMQPIPVDMPEFVAGQRAKNKSGIPLDLGCPICKEVARCVEHRSNTGLVGAHPWEASTSRVTTRCNILESKICLVNEIGHLHVGCLM